MSIRTDPRIGSTVAGYRVERLLGRGGMSVVYLATDPRLKRRVALKLLASELAEDTRFRERFLRESELAASIDHPNVIPIYEAGEADGLLYIAMRYVDGTDLKQLLHAEGRLVPARALALCAQIADALDRAHERGLVHRDVKPANVLVAAQGGREHVYLADFGLTKQASSESGLTEGGQFVGTADYVAPEQIEKGPVDGRADTYSLACVLYECLTGHAPYRSESLMAVLFAHVSETPPSAHAANPELPEDIDAVLARGLAKEACDRYPTSRELVDAAQTALGLTGQLTARRPARRRWGVVALAAAIIVALAVALSLLLTRDDGPGKPSTTPTLTPSADSIQRIDPGTNQLVATIEVGLGPIAVADGSVWLASQARGTIARIDPADNTVIASVPLRGLVPGRFAFGDGTLFLDARDDNARTTEQPLVPGTAVFSIDTDTNAAHFRRFDDFLEIRAFGAGTLWLADYTRVDSQVVRLDPRSLSARTSITVGVLAGPSAFARGALWVAASTGLVRIDGATNRVTRTGARFSIEPLAVAGGEDGVWVTNGLNKSVLRIDPGSGRIVSVIPIDSIPTALAVGEGSLWVASYGAETVSRVDAATNRVVATIDVGAPPVAIAAGAGGIWAAVDVR